LVSSFPATARPTDTALYLSALGAASRVSAAGYVARQGAHRATVRISVTDAERLNYLKLALRIVGIVATFGFYPLTVFWPSGWAWSSGRSEYLEMIIAIYATLGIFLLVASRNPNQHLGLVSFAIWSSIVHGAVMAIQSMLNPMHIHHLYGDVPALFVIAAVLAFLSPAALRLPFGRHAA